MAAKGLNDSVNIEMCLLLTVFHLVPFAVDCVVSKTVIQLFACGVVTCVFRINWCKRVLSV